MCVCVCVSFVRPSIFLSFLGMTWEHRPLVVVLYRVHLTSECLLFFTSFFFVAITDLACSVSSFNIAYRFCGMYLTIVATIGMLASLALGVTLVMYMRAREVVQHPIRTASAIRYWNLDHQYFGGKVAATIGSASVESPIGVAIDVNDTSGGDDDMNTTTSNIGNGSHDQNDENDDEHDGDGDDNAADEKTRALLSNLSADSFTIETHSGRPNFDAVIRRFAQDSALISGSSSATCFVSGPESFNAAVREACFRTNASFRGSSSKRSVASHHRPASHVVFHPISFEF